MINYKHMTVVWHMDDLKVSHIDSFEVTKFAGYLSIIYDGLSLHKGKMYDYLGIDLDCRKQGTVKLFMIKYLDSMLQESPEYLGMTAATPIADHFFTVRNEGKKQYLPENQAHNLYQKVAQKMFMSTRECQYIHTSVELLTMRVKKPYKEDWVKLKRVLK